MQFNVVRPGEYHFLFMAKGGGSANKTFLYQQTKALLNPASLMAFLEEKIKSLGTAACPPWVFSLTATPRRRGALRQLTRSCEDAQSRRSTSSLLQVPPRDRRRRPLRRAHAQDR